MADFFHSMSLKARVLLLMAALLVAGIWGLAARTATVLQDDLEKLLSDQMAATVGYVAADIDRKLQERIDTLNEVAQSITPAILADRARLHDHLRQHDSSRAIFPTGVFVVNKEATVIGEYPVIEGRIGGSIKDRDFVFAAMATGKSTIGSPVIGRFAKRPVFTLAAPINDASGKPAGVLLGSLYPSDPTLFGQLEKTKIGKTGYFFVMSPKDHLIVSGTDKRRIMQALPAKGVNPLLDKRLEQGFEGAGVAMTSLGIETLSVSRNMKTTGWFVLGGVSTEEAFAPIATLKRQIYLAALLMTLVMTVILRFVLAQQLVPLDEAGVRMRRMTDGEEPLAPLPVSREDEIGRLVGNFNRLVAERIRLDESLRKEIVERQRAEEDLHQLTAELEQRVHKRTAELETFTYSVSHDLKAPLRGIDGYSRLLLAAYAAKLDDEGRGFLQNIVRATAQMTQLIEDLLAYSRLERRDLQIGQVNPLALIESLLAERTADIKARGVAVTLAVACPSVTADRDGLAMALRNLLENALKFTRNVPQPMIEIGGRDTGTTCILSVRDNGVGFDMKFHERIFAIFQRLHRSEDYPGTGIGLAIVRKAMERMGGRAWAESEPGKGATFYLEIPK